MVGDGGWSGGREGGFTSINNVLYCAVINTLYLETVDNKLFIIGSKG
jgi:hypothetical protein